MKLHLIAALGASLLAGPVLAQDATVAAPAAEAAPAPEPAPAAEAAPAPAAAPAADIVPGKVATPAPGKGQVVFFRQNKFAGAAVSYKIRTGAAGETILGTISNGVYFVFQADPGTYSFSGATESKDAITLEVEEGETYFVEGSLAIGIMMGRPNLLPSNQAAFEKAAKNIKLAKK